MKCIDEAQMQRYLDSECGQVEGEEIRQHLAQCRSCSDSFTKYSERLAKVKRSLGLLIAQQTLIPEFKVPTRTTQQRGVILIYILPLVAAASLLLLFILRPFYKAEKLPPNELYLQSYISADFDANKPVAEYPLIMTIIAPDGSVSQTIIN
ncbi:MAG TPA: zf-HC2 domain-containing protein [Bacteroidales bacterium]|nr:zf-HC2 domain-containing protein [Bacteroidales bacterium]